MRPDPVIYIPIHHKASALKDALVLPLFDPQPAANPLVFGPAGPILADLGAERNDHIGHVPTELGNLTRLRVLYLHKNNLNGSIPVSLDRLTGLWSLDLSSIILTGSIPCLSSPVLSTIDLSQNHLMGSIPPSISTCRSLIKMDLSRNQLTGSIPESLIDDLKDLTLMDLSCNRLSGPLPSWLRSLVSLQALILKGNPMAGVPHNSKRFVSRHEELDDLGSFQHELGRSNSNFTCPFAESPRASSRQKPLQQFDSRKVWRAEESERAEIKRQFLNRASPVWERDGLEDEKEAQALQQFGSLLRCQ